MDPEADQAQRDSRIDRLMDAIELVKQNEREQARILLRELIREDNDFEDAWLWMSVAVDSLDQSSICLDNALRVNPRNQEAASALHRIRSREMQMARQRSRLHFYRDLSIGAMWLLIMLVLYGVMATYAALAG